MRALDGPRRAEISRDAASASRSTRRRLRLVSLAQSASVRRLVGAVIITADADMLGTCDRPDMVDVVGHIRQRRPGARMECGPLIGELETVGEVVRVQAAALH